MPIVNVSLPTVVHVHAVGRLVAGDQVAGAHQLDPARRGRLAADVLTLASPSRGRRWNGTPLAADDATSMKACAADGDSELRIITPALVQAWTFWIVVDARDDGAVALERAVGVVERVRGAPDVGAGAGHREGAVR